MTALKMEPHDPATMASTMAENMRLAWNSVAVAGGEGTHVVLTCVPYGRGWSVNSWVAGGDVARMLMLVDNMVGTIQDVVRAQYQGADAEALLVRLAQVRKALDMEACAPAEIADA